MQVMPVFGGLYVLKITGPKGVNKVSHMSTVYLSKPPPSILLSTVEIIHQFAKDFKEKRFQYRGI